MHLRTLVVLTGVIAGSSAMAEEFNVDGLYNCARATNGKAYCQRVGRGDIYFLVSDSFLARFQAIAAARRSNEHELSATVPQSPNGNTLVQQQQNNTVIINNLRSDASEARGLIDLFTAIIAEQHKMATARPELSDVTSQAIVVLQAKVADLKRRFIEKTTELSQYQTSIRPNDPDLQITARKASELYPKVPFYIPGTPETGEFWMEPVVTDTGELAFSLRFIDPKSDNDKTRGTITLNAAQLEATKDALAELVRWSKVAHDNHIRRTFTRRATCFPEANCPPENGPKRDGVASTEIDFKIYEDGSTAGRIQRNKGRFEDGYNISIDSSLLLEAYFNHVLTEGKTDFEAGSRTDDQLRELFK